MFDREGYAAALEMLREAFPEDKAFITFAQAARYCRVDPRTLQADRTLPRKDVGKRQVIPVVGMARWLATNY